MQQANAEISDVLVIGGGISGLAIAREAAEKGLRCVLLERGQCGHATSDQSLRIMHGGFRYLQSFDFARVIESIKNQMHLQKSLPDMLRSLPCIMPLQSFGLRSRVPVTIALWIYRAMCCCIGKQDFEGKVLRTSELLSRLPILSQIDASDVLLWTDLEIRSPQDLCQKLKSSGSFKLCEQTTATSIHNQEGMWSVHAESAGASLTYQAKTVVNATGPFIQTLNVNPPTIERYTGKWCRAFNVVVKQKLLEHYALGVHSDEGRLFFLVPRGEATAIGTGYLEMLSDAHEARITNEELSHFLRQLTGALPQVKLSLDDIVKVECGILPMRKLGARGPELLGPYQVIGGQGYVEVVSTKYTTFQTQAQSVVRHLQGYLR